MIRWEDREYVNPKKKVFKNLDTNEILNLELQEDSNNILKEGVPLSAYNLNRMQNMVEEKGTSIQITDAAKGSYGKLEIEGNSYHKQGIDEINNLFDKEEILPAIGNVSGYVSTNYIPAATGERIVKNNTTTLYFYDSNKQSLGSSPTWTNNRITKENVAYVRCNVGVFEIDTFRIAKPLFVPFTQRTITTEGITLTVNTDNTITLNGTCAKNVWIEIGFAVQNGTAVKTTKLFSLDPKKTYDFALKQKAGQVKNMYTNITFQVDENDTKIGGPAIAKNQAGTSKIATNCNGIYRAYLYIPGGAIFEEMQFEVLVREVANETITCKEIKIKKTRKEYC